MIDFAIAIAELSNSLCERTHNQLVYLPINKGCVSWFLSRWKALAEKKSSETFWDWQMDIERTGVQGNEFNPFVREQNTV